MPTKARPTSLASLAPPRRAATGPDEPAVAPTSDAPPPGLRADRDGPSREEVARWLLADAASLARALELGGDTRLELAWLTAHADQLRELVHRARPG
jgi:hypothetical protein